MSSYTTVGFRPNWIYVHATATQSLAQGTDQLITFSASPVIQVGDGLSYNGTDTITVSRAGYYEIYGHGAIDGGTPGYSRIVALFVNGNAVHFINNPGYADGGTGVTWRNQVRYCLNLAVNDTITLKFRFEDPSNPGTNRDTNPNYEGVALGVRQLVT